MHFCQQNVDSVNSENLIKGPFTLAVFAAKKCTGTVTAALLDLVSLGDATTNTFFLLVVASPKEGCSGNANVNVLCVFDNKMSPV